MTTRFWVDCDPGHDDAFALLLAAHDAEAELVICSTTHGNASLERTTQNASSVLRALYASVEVKIFKGASDPLYGLCQVAQEIHGKSGLDGTELLPEPMSDAIETSGVFGMLEYLRQQTPDEELMVLCATGPVTNIALLTQQDPDLLGARFKQLVMMGGALTTGNWTSQAEFNVWADPHALQQVLEAPCWHGKRVIIPLEVTHKLILTEAVLLEMRRRCDDSQFAQMWKELGTFFNKTYKDVFGFMSGGPVHDPATVAYALDPTGLFTGRDLFVEVDTREGPTKGRTVVDVWNQTGHAPNAFVCEDVTADGVERFWQRIVDAMVRANEVSIVNKAK